MKLRISVLTLLIIATVTPVFSQKFAKIKPAEFKISETGYKEAIKLVRKANGQFKRNKKGGYAEAVKLYLKAYEYNPDNAALNYQIALSYLKSANKMLALKYIEDAYDLNENLNTDILLVKALAQQQAQKFDEAAQTYEEYLETLDPKKLQKTKTKIDRKIEECNNGSEFAKNPIRCFIDNLGDSLNTEFPEYSPIFFEPDSIIYFTSRRPNTTGGKKDLRTQLFFEDIYFAKAQKGKWLEITQLNKPVNTKHNDAAVDISPEGKEICIYKGNTGKGDLFNSQLYDNEWQALDKLHKINEKNSRESSVSISKDSLTLYFISDRNGSIGGQDIWYSYRTQDGKRWQKPENIGAVINTKFDEETVEISSDGKTLFFSSKGHNTMGGYDIFKSTKNDDGTWNTPENIGFPINTPDDDVFFMLSPNERFGYYSCDREGGFGDKDIYQVIFLGPERPVNVSETQSNELIAYQILPVSESDIEKPVNIITIQLSMVKGIVTDAFSGKPIEASLELVDNADGKIVKTVSTYPATGSYTVTLPPGKNYALTAGAPDYFFYSENFIIHDTSTHEIIRKDIQLQPMGIGAKIVLNNVFFDSGKSTLRPESFTELNRLSTILKQYPNLKIEISGHTDNKGSDTYNLKLSQQRAQAVSDYIVNQGINLAQITATGYGETSPRADNITEEGRQLNRRVEAKILEK